MSTQRGIIYIAIALMATGGCEVPGEAYEAPGPPASDEHRSRVPGYHTLQVATPRADGCRWEEYQQAIDCAAAVSVPETGRASAGAFLTGDDYECAAEFECRPDWTARVAWERAECFAGCQGSHRLDYVRELCAAEEQISLRGCLARHEFECVDLDEAHASEQLANCRTVAAGYRDNCELAGHMTELPTWVVHPEPQECSSSEFATAQECRTVWEKRGEDRAVACESAELPRISEDWAAAGKAGDPDPGFVECSLAQRCGAPATSEFADEVEACVSPCGDSHSDELRDARCARTSAAAIGDCLAGVSCWDDGAALELCESVGSSTLSVCLGD